MLRRLALLVALLGPATGLAQSAGTVQITPSSFGKTACTSTADTVTLTWTSSATIATGDVYRVYVSSTSATCPTASGTPAGYAQLAAGDIAATAQTQSYPGTLTQADFLTAAGANCTANATIYVCVQHWATGGGSTAKATATGSAKLEVLPPPVPVNVAVAPGDSALFVSWADGTANGVAAVSYNVTAVAQGNPADFQTKNFVGRTNNRIDQLTNGTTYDVTVTSLSSGGNESLPSSPAVSGTPQPVNGFWEQYTADSGREQGGCAGGPAGALSLLGVALALRGLRRRS